MWVTVRSMDGKTSHRVDKLSKLTTIQDLRLRLTEFFEAPPERQRLFYQGKQLEDGHTLFDYDVGLNDIIQIMIRPVLPDPSKSETAISSKKSSAMDLLTSSQEQKLQDQTSDSKNGIAVELTMSERRAVNQSNYFKVGDLIDAQDLSSGTWWEAVIVGIECCNPEYCDNSLGTNDHSSTSYGIRESENSAPKYSPKKRSIANLTESTFLNEDIEEPANSKQESHSNVVESTTNENGQTSTERPSDDGFIYSVLYQRYSWDEDPVSLKIKDIRYRSHEILNFDDVSEGMSVMVNYNIESSKERGYWYDCVITHKKNTRTQKELYGTIFIGCDRTPLEQCQIVFIHEVYKVPGSLIELSKRTFDLQTLVANNLPNKREVKPECSHCNDHPRRKCKYCSCAICGGKNNPSKQILCDECDDAYHIWCLDPPLETVPNDEEWYCPNCKTDETEVVRAGEKLKESKKKAKMASKITQSTRDWGKGMACVGRTKECTIVPADHFGSIPGIDVGMQWKFRVQVSEAGVHRPHVAGIHGRETIGAFSIVLAGGYEDDLDKGEEFFYTGSGGRDLSGNKRTAEQSSDQKLTKMNKALARNCAAPLNAEKGAEAKDWKAGKPVRVIRSYKGRKHSKYAPEEGMRYDGIYKVVKYWPERGKSGFIVWRYLLRRDDPSPAPWTKAGKRFIKEMGFTIQYPEGYLEAIQGKNHSSITNSPVAKSKRKSQDTAESPQTKKNRSNAAFLDGESKNLIAEDVKNKKIWNDCLDSLEEGKLTFLKKVEELFLCICCQDLVYQPVTTECAHNFCKSCLNRSFQAKVYSCPICRHNLGTDYELCVNSPLSHALLHLFPGYEAGRS